LRAARVLLKQRADLDAVRVLHAEIAGRLVVPATAQAALESSSWAEARRRQQELLAEWERRCPDPLSLGAFRRLRRRAPPWFGPALVAFAVAVVCARYAWRVTYGKDWSQQNPEGNWVSRFYGDDAFGGYPMVRYDIGVNADFGSGAPADAMRTNGFSVRWDTCLVVLEAIAVPLELTSDDSSQLFVDGQQQFEVKPGPGRSGALVKLLPGVHPIRVDFVEGVGTAMVRLDGFELDGTAAYTFRRPVIEGEELKCR